MCHLLSFTTLGFPIFIRGLDYLIHVPFGVHALFLYGFYPSYTVLPNPF
ncbi:hypothetical protein UVUMRFZT_CDS0010 [Staphylococcus phage LJLAME001]